MKRETVNRTGKIVSDTGETVKRPGETGTEDGGPTEGAKDENMTIHEIWQKNNCIAGSNPFPSAPKPTSSHLS